MPPETVFDRMHAAGMTRRAFLRYCVAAAGLMGLRPLLPIGPARGPRSAAAGPIPALARALQTKPRLPVIWLAYQDCAGCTEALLRSQDPLVSSVLLDVLSLEYHETLSAGTGASIEAHRADVMARFSGQYLLVVEGSIPVRNAGYCTIGGRDAEDVFRECAAGAAAVLATGNCACFGGLPAASPNPTGARNVADMGHGPPLVHVPGCPAIPEVTAGTLLHYFTYDAFPEVDALSRPLPYYGETVHDGCPRRPHFRRAEFAARFDDQAARDGWCLFELGCRGPETFNACATRKWGDGLSFPVASGHPCLGCSEPRFWDRFHVYPWMPRDHGAFLPYAENSPGQGELE